jgi:hypothetical protein
VPYTFLGVQDRQELFVPVEVGSLEGNFDTLKNLSLQLYESQNKNFNFGTTKALILHIWSIFFKGDHPTKIWSKKYFHENPSPISQLFTFFNDDVTVYSPHRLSCPSK